MVLFSCQKEIDFDFESPADGGVGNPNGNLLVKATQITLSTNDTNFIGVKWNSANKLIEYSTNGKVNGFPTKFTSTINRGSDGKIQTIVSKTELQNTIMDSIVYKVSYKPATSQLAYVTSTQHSFLGDIEDSTFYTYNAAGRVVTKETHQALFGPMMPSVRQTYEYDGNGNVTKINSFEFTGSGFAPSGTSTYTYTTHKSAITLGEESFIILGGENVSVNGISKLETDATSSGNAYTLTTSNVVYNSFDRPSEAIISVTPNPPGYQVKVLYYY